MTRHLSTRRRVLLGAVACIAAVATGCIPKPEWYDVPATLPAAPGDIVRTYPVLFDGTDTYRGTAIMYRSTSATNQPNVVTGTLYEPKEPWTGPGSRPVIGFGVGTQGQGDRCAPSQTLPVGSNYEKGTILELLAQGWAVAVTDYEKLGTAGDHTYVVRLAEAHAVLDMVRAAQRVPESSVEPDSPVALWGYSQGGQAAAAAAEVEAAYAPELDVRGVVAGGVPSDLTVMAEHLNGPGNAWFTILAFAALGLNSAYPELDLESYLTPEALTLLDSVRTGPGYCLFDGLPILANRRIEELTTTNPLATPQWLARLAEQRVGTIAPAVPAFLYHGAVDQLVPYELGTGLRDAWCGLGADVTFTAYPVDHFGGLVAGTTDGVAFLTDRFAGVPSTPGC
ncbi:MAG TPA: lipase family protein [Acidimicrobiales bacterium]|nr:lipolytic protein [uncultured bacterium]